MVIAAENGAQSAFRTPMLAAAFAVLTFVVAAASIAVSRDETTISAVWPANAVVFALLLRRPRENWSAALLGAYFGYFFANLSLGNGAVVAIFCSGANIAEITICAATLTFRNTPDFGAGRIEDFIRLLIGGALGTATSAAIAATAIAAGNGGNALLVFEAWFISDYLGLLIYTPIVAILLSGNLENMLKGERRTATALAVWAFIGVMLAVIFLQSDIDLLPVAPLLLILCAFVFEPASVAFAIALTSLVAIASTAMNLGPSEIASGAMTDRLHYLQAFLALLVLSGIPTGIALSRKRRLERSLTAQHAAAVAARDALAEANARAEAASEAKSAFLANMSHEIRTPLNGVLGFADALSVTKLDKDQRSMLQLIITSGESLNALISDILDVARIEEGRLTVVRERFDLATTVGAAAELMRARAEEKGLELEITTSRAAEGAFLGDALRVRQIVLNLVSNAVKFTAAGKIVVHIDAEDEVPGAASVIRLSVEDTGIGFDEETRGRLFARFEQADASITRRFGGSGLGLAISRSLAELMGGSIETRSTPGAGSAFIVTLPLERVSGIAATPPDAARSDLAPRATTRVLVAEDHPINQRVIQAILEPNAVDLMIVQNGKEALEAFGEGHFDLVLMDLQMPVMDGLAATRAIRSLEETRGVAIRTPIVALSANALSEHVEQALAAGCDSHIAKPVSAKALLQHVAFWSGGAVKGDAA